jgi:hypothetical protein
MVAGMVEVMGAEQTKLTAKQARAECFESLKNNQN